MPLPTFPTQPTPSLRRDVTPREVSQQEIFRRRYGGNLDLASIDRAVTDANIGLMATLTDLSSEIRTQDLSMTGALNKRFLGIRNVPRQLIQSSDAEVERAVDAKHSVEAALARCHHLTKAIKILSWGLFNGRSCAEMHWEAVPPIGVAPFVIRWLPVEMRWVPPRSLSFGPERELRVIDPWRQQGYFRNTDGFALRDYPGKFLSWTPQMFDEYPEREGLAPACIFWSFFKRFAWRMRMKLIEIYGIPWRIVRSPMLPDGSSASWDEVQLAAEAIESLGGDTTAAVPPGIDVDVVVPNNTAAPEFFSMTSNDVDSQITRLILGQEGTTVGQPGGLNGNQTTVMKGEQDLIAAGDHEEMGDTLSEQLLYLIASVNWGEEAAARFAPRMKCAHDEPRDRNADLTVADRAISMGVPVALAQVREMAALREPAEDEELALHSSSNGARPPPPSPDDTTDEDGADAADKASVTDAPTTKLEVTPSDTAYVVRVDEVRDAAGLAPVPGGDAFLPEWKAKFAPEAAEVAKAEDGVAPGEKKPAPPPFGAVPPPAPNDKPAPAAASDTPAKEPPAFAKADDRLEQLVRHAMVVDQLSRADAELAVLADLRALRRKSEDRPAE